MTQLNQTLCVCREHGGHGQNASHHQWGWIPRHGPRDNGLLTDLAESGNFSKGRPLQHPHLLLIRC